MIYFMQSNKSDPIKIGYTKNKWTLKDRLIYIQKQYYDSNLKVINTKPGTQKEEKLIHQIFGSIRLEGEWFRPKDYLMGFINSSVSIEQKIKENIDIILKNKKNKKETKTMAIRIPRPIWAKLFMLQTSFEIKSINQAAIDGFKLIIKQIEAKTI